MTLSFATSSQSSSQGSVAAASGKTEWDEVRYLIRDRVSGNVIVLSGWKAELRVELDRCADEMGLSSEEFAKRILVDHLAASMRERKANGRKTEK